MIVFERLEDIVNIEPTVVALGNFDGIHKGHQEIIGRTVKEAEAAGLRKRVININANKAERDALVSLVRSRGGVDYARERLELYVGRAIDALGIFPAGDDRERMEGLARFVAERKI